MTCPGCDAAITWPDYRRGRLGLCRTCDGLVRAQNAANYDRDRARDLAATMNRHPAGSRLRPIREWWAEHEFLSHTSHWKPVR